MPQYEVLQTVGPEHNKIFTVEVLLDGKRLGLGKGRNKKQAEQEAARDAYARLNRGNNHSPEAKSAV